MKTLEEQRIKYGQRASFIGISCNILLSAAKLAIGLFSGMVSIIADSINNLSDAVSGVISLISFKLSAKPADEDHPFGHARYEYVAGLVVSFLVMIAGAELLRTGIEKIINPEPINATAVTFIVLGIAIAVKLFMSVFYYISGKKIDSSVLIATSEDSRNDAISTSAVLIAALISKFAEINLDGIMACLVACFIIFSGIILIKDTISPLLGKSPDPEFVQKLETEIKSYEGVLGTHDLMVHDYGPGHCFATVHVEVPAERSVLECHELIDMMEVKISKKLNIHLVIHYDPIVTTDSLVGELRLYISNEAKKINEKLTVHDLRLVPGQHVTNVIFDCVIPHELISKEKEIIKELKEKVVQKDSKFNPVINIDHSFVSIK